MNEAVILEKSLLGPCNVAVNYNANEKGKQDRAEGQKGVEGKKNGGKF